MIHLCATTHVRLNQYLRDMTPLYVTWLLCMWHGSFARDMTDSYIYVTWRHIFICDAKSIASYTHIWRDIHTWDLRVDIKLRHLYARQTFLISPLIWPCALALRHCQVAAGTYVTWLIYSATTRVTRIKHMWQDSFTRDMTHLHVRHDSPHRWHNILLSLFDIVK